MKQVSYKFTLLLSAVLMFSLYGKTQNATIFVDDNTRHQKITGFGGFANGPQFQYNWMTPAQIRQLWGPDSEMKYNIMRIFIPVGENNFQQAVPTAQLAQSLGITLFASPWTMPAEWKTNNHINAVHDGIVGYLKEEHYEDYAHYLNNFVLLMRENGVELAAISIQNEPDYTPGYHGCRFTPQQMATFIRDYGHIITAPIMAAEGVGITDNYANAMLPDAVFNNLGIFAGHQYGPIQTAHKKLQEKGMEVWQSEFLINWNANQATNRNFNWSIDAFDFAKAVNTALLADINAWVHYASRRYYGMMGDGLHGTQNGVITKRGYILSHFAQYTTGTTRVKHTWNDATNVLDGSAYISESGDTVIIKVINPSNNPYTLTVDLPFFTLDGQSIATTSTANLVTTELEFSQETFRPRVEVAASSFTTLMFVKSAERPFSEMVGQPIFYGSIENQTVTNAAFGDAYQMSGKTFVFDNSRALISPNTNASNGYLELDDRYNKLVFRVESISSPVAYTSASTTLYYINADGVARSHNYGAINFSPQGRFNWVLDISRNVLTDGCIGIIGLRNGNWTSILTMTFGDVYFLIDDEKAFQFSGPYSTGDSNLLDCLEDAAITSLDFSETTGITPDLNWNATAENKNAIFYVDQDAVNNNVNVVRGDQSTELRLTSEGGNFFVPYNFTASSASYSRTIDGFEMLVLPYEAIIPEGARGFMLKYENSQINGARIIDNVVPANTPVLIHGTGSFTFTGTGEVSTPRALTVNNFNGVYISTHAPANSYALNLTSGGLTFGRVVKGAEPVITPFSAYFDPGASVTASSVPVILDDATTTDPFNFNVINPEDKNVIYDLWGRPVAHPQKGVIYIINGKKQVFH